MDKKGVPAEFVLAAVLSSGITIVTSITYIVLCSVALVFRADCVAGQLIESHGAEYFLTTVFRVYIQNADCQNALKYNGLTQSHSVFILTVLILTISVLCLCASIALIAVSYHENGGETINIYVCIHIAVHIAALVVDLTLGIHFGMDHSLLKDELSFSPPGLGMNYEKDMIRLGALFLMTISLKGYVIPAINIVLLIILVVYAVQHQQSKNPPHSIHNLGPLNAYERPKRVDDPWHTQNNDIPYQQHGYHLNNAYHDDEPHRRNLRDTPSDLSNRPHDRSNSWQSSQPGPGLGSRPFSYLEESKRPTPLPVPVKPPVMPPKEPNWRRDQWPQGPYVPDPDYSPPSRRLKSALKTGYN